MDALDSRLCIGETQKHSDKDNLLNCFSELLLDCSYGIIISDENCNLLYQNQLAREITTAKKGLTIFSGRIQAPSPRGQRQLREAIKQAALITSGHSDPARKPSPIPLSIPSGEEGRLLFLTVQAIRTSNATFLIITIDSRTKWRSVPEHLLKTYFQLTPAECTVAKRLISGNTTEAIAKSLEISSNTVKTHARNIYAKTNVNRQMELVQLASSMPSSLWR